MIRGYNDSVVHSVMKRTWLTYRHVMAERMGLVGVLGIPEARRVVFPGEERTESGHQVSRRRWRMNTGYRNRRRRAKRAEKLSELKAHCCAAKGNKGATTVGQLAAT